MNYNPIHPHCGPGNSVSSEAPSDPVDRACWIHDQQYGQLENPYFTFNSADQQFIDALEDEKGFGAAFYREVFKAKKRFLQHHTELSLASNKAKKGDSNTVYDEANKFAPIIYGTGIFKPTFNKSGVYLGHHLETRKGLRFEDLLDEKDFDPEQISVLPYIFNAEEKVDFVDNVAPAVRANSFRKNLSSLQMPFRSRRGGGRYRKGRKRRMSRRPLSSRARKAVKAIVSRKLEESPVYSSDTLEGSQFPTNANQCYWIFGECVTAAIITALLATGRRRFIRSPTASVAVLENEVSDYNATYRPYTRLAMKDAGSFCQWSFRNNDIGANDAILDCYTYLCIDDTNTSFQTCLETGYAEYLSDASANKTSPLCWPSMARKRINQYYKLIDHKKFYLKPGQACRYTVKQNHSGSDQIESVGGDTNTYLAGRTKVAVFRLQGWIAHDAVNTTNVGLSDVTLDYIKRNVVRVKYTSSEELPRITNTTSGLDTIANGAVQMNLDQD